MRKNIFFTKEDLSRAFTLVELLVVIAIISILAGMLLPALENAIGSARTISCVGNLKQLSLANLNYVHDNNDWFPDDADKNWTQHLGGYFDYDWDNKHTLSGFSLFHCPAGEPYTTLEYMSCGYIANRAVVDTNLFGTGNLRTMETPGNTLVLTEGHSHAVGREIGEELTVADGATTLRVHLSAAEINKIYYRHNNNLSINVMFGDGHVSTTVRSDHVVNTTFVPSGVRWYNTPGVVY
ncbi:MAG: type II secretion system protein [Planctomycetota bacterium]|jgi:prepilin-type N-terminal cleavage/methylation domain-containing protein/prepilin-type processing-associated H-X9-DG protein